MAFQVSVHNDSPIFQHTQKMFGGVTVAESTMVEMYT